MSDMDKLYGIVMSVLTFALWIALVIGMFIGYWVQDGSFWLLMPLAVILSWIIISVFYTAIYRG
jgi:hypothetical protein